jgi:hypothetical protein
MASSISAGTTSSTALVATADTSGALQLATNNGTVAVTVNTSQNVGIGTTSPAYKLDVNGNINIPADSFYYIGTTSPNDRYIKYRSSQNDVLYSGYSGLFYKQDVAGVYHAWFTGNNERMRIDSSGAVLVNTTTRNSLGVVEILTTVGIDNALVLKTPESGAGGIATMMQTRYNATTVGSITATSSATAYNTASDYRLKENIIPMTGALAKVAALKPVTYKWKIDNADGQGFIAHELQEIVPDCVSGEKDAIDEDGNPKYQGIDVSFLVATLTAAIQELSAKVTALEEQVLNLGVK